MNVEFGTPEGYVEPTHSVATQPVIASSHTADLPPAVRVPLAVDAFVPFSSTGHRLVSKVKPEGTTAQRFTPVHILRCDSDDNRDIICSSLKKIYG
jgi:hypothetical protein